MNQRIVRLLGGILTVVASFCKKKTHNNGSFIPRISLCLIPLPLHDGDATHSFNLISFGPTITNALGMFTLFCDQRTNVFHHQPTKRNHNCKLWKFKICSSDLEVYPFYNFSFNV